MLLPLLLSAALGAPLHVVDARDRVDWQVAGDEAVRVLSEYLAIDTINPPGNEEAGARYLAGLLDAEGIATEIVPHAPGRASLIARLPGAGPEAPLCLLSHLDVVPAERDRWSFEPLSGKVEDGQVYGRGALDMKGLGALQVMSMVWLARLQVPLAREVVLLAVADEEVDNVGMRTLVEERWAEIGCSHLLNEGGIGIRDALFEGEDLHGISVAEKGVLWIDVIAEGPAGHGSVEQPGEAPGRLLQALKQIEKRRARPREVAEVRALLHAVGVHHGGAVGAVMRSRALSALLVRPRLMKIPATRAVMTDTVHLTGFDGYVGHNTVPSQVRATLDCRLLPGTTADDILADLRRRTRRIEGVRFEVVAYDPASVSAWEGDPVYDAIARYAVEGRPHAVAAPILSVGFTDSLFARQAGVRAYGYAPFVVTPEEAATMHGHDERVSVENVHEGLRRLFSVVVDVAGAPVTGSAPTTIWGGLEAPQE